MDSHRTEGGDEKEGRARKDGGNASEQGGAAGLLHEISKPTAWRRGVQILVNEQEDARFWIVVKQKGKNGQNTGGVMRRCKIWRQAVEE